MNRPPLSILKLPLLLGLLALLLASASVLWSRGLAQQSDQRLQQARSELNSAQRQLDRSRQQRQLIATHLDAYQALSERGFVGAEDRLAWIEAAQLANRDAGLYGLSYRLTPRTRSLPALSQGLPLGQTTMVLSMPLLVETDLMRFLSALRSRAPGVYRVEACRLSWLSTAPFEAINQPRLQAECDLNWFTVAATAGPAS